jgi:phosphate transport system substrate-binding protein
MLESKGDVVFTRSGIFPILARRFGLLAAVCAVLASAAMADEIKIGGTGNALGTMRLLGDAFSKKYPATKVVVLSSLGSSGAIKAVPKGAIDIGLTSRALSDEEGAGALATEYARAPTVLAVSKTSKVTAISREQIADIYTGKLANWPDGTPIRPVLRQPGDDNTKQIKSLAPAIEQALNVAEQRPGLAFAVTDQEAADKIESIPGAIGVTTVALILAEGRGLRPLKLDGVEPTTKNGSSGSYPIIKRFFFITQPAPSPAVRQFITFVKSPDGRKILTQTGHWAP